MRQTILRDDLLKYMSCSKESIAKPNYRAKSRQHNTEPEKVGSPNAHCVIYI